MLPTIRVALEFKGFNATCVEIINHPGKYKKTACEQTYEDVVQTSLARQEIEKGLRIV